jgi:class 3 adenylate cyclase/pimeloyl-ACP methyl ester carboxylesterase
MARRLAAILAADVAGYSRLMSADEAGTLAALQAHRSELIAPTIERHGGRIVKLIGDGVLAEFNSVVEAIECAAEIQREMEVRNRGLADDRRMLLRMGVHLGDIIIDGDDIYGDGVNIAARLQAVAETGGICISRQAYDQVDGKLPLSYRPLGAQTLKNIPKPVEIYAIELNGAAGRTDRADMKLKVNYCRAADGVRLAYASAGSGPPLVKTANWMNHVEYDWENSAFSHFFVALARDFKLLRYDARGNGLSDWDVEDVSLDAWVSDLETVVDAAGLERFPLLGMSQGCAISVAFAVRHPERVSHLILYPLRRICARRISSGEERTRAAKGQGACDLDPHGMGRRYTRLPAAILLLVHARRNAGATAEIRRAATQDDHGRMRLPLFRDHPEFGRERFAAQGQRANSRHAQARRPSAAVRGGARACRRDSRCALRGAAGTKSHPVGAGR